MIKRIFRAFTPLVTSLSAETFLIYYRCLIVFHHYLNETTSDYCDHANSERVASHQEAFFITTLSFLYNQLVQLITL